MHPEMNSELVRLDYEKLRGGNVGIFMAVQSGQRSIDYGADFTNFC